MEKQIDEGIFALHDSRARAKRKKSSVLQNSRQVEFKEGKQDRFSK